MTDGADAETIRKSAQTLYRAGQPIWNPSDAWNTYKRARIDAFVRLNCAELLKQSECVLNAGSGGEAYEWLPPSAVNVDLFEAQVRKLSSAVVGNLEETPFVPAAFDMIVCVGSVLNYISAIEALREMDRILKPGGHLILHYETSESFEHLGYPRWRKPVARVETFNSGQADTVWVYSRSFIRDIVGGFGWSIIHAERFHILSTLGTRLGLSAQRAAAWAAMDRWLGPLNHFADDEIILIAKTA